MTTETQKDGGPAFPMPSGPEPRVNDTTHYNEGMSLRDYFAAAALPAAMTMMAQVKCASPKEAAEAYVYSVELSYLMADAMLKARATGDKSGTESKTT
jgi:hypothetical protein